MIRFYFHPAPNPAKVSLFLEESGLAYEVIPVDMNKDRREVARHYQVLNDHLAGREHIVGSDYSIVDMSAWGWIDRAFRVLPGEEEALAAFPHLKRWFQCVDARPAVARAREVGKGHAFKTVTDEETRRAMFPSNYPPAAGAPGSRSSDSQ
jgi:GST-like protein